MNLRPKIKRLRELCLENSISMLGVFGSVARGEDTPESDVDLLVKLEKPIGLWKFIALEDKFAEILGRKVDLATESALHPLIHSNVMRDLKILYEADQK